MSTPFPPSTPMPSSTPHAPTPPISGEVPDEVHLGAGAVRDPFVVAVLVVVTFGIYQLFWWYAINREMADRGRSLGTRELGDSPALSTLALFPGCILVVPAIWTTVTTFQRVQATQRFAGREPLNGWIALILAFLLSPALCAYLQSGLNSAWTADASTPRSRVS